MRACVCGGGLDITFGTTGSWLDVKLEEEDFSKHVIKSKYGVRLQAGGLGVVEWKSNHLEGGCWIKRRRESHIPSLLWGIRVAYPNA